MDEMTPEMWRQWAIETAISRNLAGIPLSEIIKQADMLLHYVMGEQTPIPEVFK